MKISQSGGENVIIDIIKAQADTNDGLYLGIGDDAALIVPDVAMSIVTTDLLAEDVHFRMDINTFYDLGYKSIAVNLSDIAAMGGIATYSFISVALPDMEIDSVKEIYRGMCDASKKYGSVIAGGDTTRSADKIVINVTQLGAVMPYHVTKRSTAAIGDSIIVTNNIGLSRAGLELLLKFGYEKAMKISPICVAAHIHPEPQMAAARAAAVTTKVSAMMDLSDGLASDISKLCAASMVGAEIYAAKLPICDELIRVSDILGSDPTELAVGGGEDYELLITSSDPHRICEEISKKGVFATVIGTIIEGENPYLILDGKKCELFGAWEHF